MLDQVLSSADKEIMNLLELIAESASRYSLPMIWVLSNALLLHMISSFSLKKNYINLT